MNKLRLSKFGLLIVLSFILISLIARVLLPFADEPDWSFTALNILLGDHPIWSPYYIFRNWLDTLLIDSACEPRAQGSPAKSWIHTSHECSENFEQVLLRWIITLFILTPMFLIIVFRLTFIRFMNVLHIRLSFDEWKHRIDALALSLLLPGMLFNLGNLSVEQLHLVVALYIFLFWSFWFLISSLFLIMLSIDFGNSLVAFFFFGALWFFTHLRILGRWLFFLFIILLVCVPYFFRIEFLDAILNNSFITGEFEEKLLAMKKALYQDDILIKYPVFLRPIITYMSFIFLTPAGVKVTLLYVLFSLTFVWVTLKVIANRDSKADVFWFIPVAVIVFFIFLFPAYANAKYYIFMLPFLIYVSLLFFNKMNIFLFFMAANAFVFLHLLLFRIS
jgi:hypothetical protein